MPDEPENLVLRPRDVRFDWSALPAHWIAGEPFATHVFNVMHLLLPEGERCWRGRCATTIGYSPTTNARTR
jgi:predicted metal-dependent hydrolase